MLKKRVLGRTGLEVSELAMGGLFVASFVTELERGKQTVRRALELGVNYIDTAPTYGNSEEVLGHALEGVTTPYIISTKLGGRPQPFKPQDKDCLRRSVEESLRLLKRDQVDLLLVHEPDRPGQYDWWPNWNQLETAPVYELLSELKREGIIKYLGLGGTTPYEMAHLLRSGLFDVVLTAFNYSLLWREAELDVLPTAIKQNLGIIIGSPLQQGALARRYPVIDEGRPWLSPPRRAQFQALYKLLDEVQIPLPELALRFVLSNPNVSTVLMGPRSPEEVEQNVASANKGPLPKALLKKLDTIAKMVPFRPCGEAPGLGWFLGTPDNYKGPGQM